MTHRVIILTAFLFGACGCGQPFAPPDAVAFTPPPTYREWWLASRACIAKPEVRTFEAIRWYRTAAEITLDGQTAAAVTVGERVYIQAMYDSVPWVIQHELVHAINGISGHPIDPFHTCHLMTWQENQ